jgi:hypothetical protein
MRRLRLLEARVKLWLASGRVEIAERIEQRIAVLRGLWRGAAA